MEKNNFNFSRVILLHDMNRAQMKKRVLTSALAERQKFLLLWVLDQADSFHLITVAQIRKELSLGERKWGKLRDQLIEMGVLTQAHDRRPNGSSTWTLVFDFTQFKDSKLSTGEIKMQGSRARACDPLKMQGSGNPLVLQGSHDPHYGAGINLKGSNLKNNHHENSGGFLRAQGDQEQPKNQNLGAGALRPSHSFGLTGTTAANFDKRCQGASSAHLKLLGALYSKKKASGGIEDEGAWLVGMIGKIVAGEITPAPAGSDSETSVARQIELLKLPPGSVIHSVTGKTWTVSAQSDGCRVMHEGHWVGPQVTLEVLRRVQAGELNVRQPAP